MLDNITLSNLPTNATVKRTNRENKVHVQKSFAVSLDASGTTWKIPYLKSLKGKTFPTERLCLLSSLNTRLSKDSKYLYVSEVFDDYGITVRIEFMIKLTGLNLENYEERLTESIGG